MIDPCRSAVDLDLGVREILHTWTGDRGAGVGHDCPKFPDGVPIPIGVGKDSSAAARTVVRIAHIVPEFVGEGAVCDTVTIRHAECPRGKSGPRAVRHDIGDAAIGSAVIHDQCDHIGLILIAQLMNRIHEPIIGPL